MRRLTFTQSHCLACRSCEIACVLAHSQAENLDIGVARNAHGEATRSYRQ